jgi:predicted anti-sigma-YlaC factor YlaD
MPCPDLGALRASLDDAPGGAPALPHDHVRGCASCRDVLAELRRNAELAAPAIAMTGPDDPLPPAAIEAALARLEQRRTRLLAARAARAANGATATAGDAGGPAARAWPG